MGRDSSTISVSSAPPASHRAALHSAVGWIEIEVRGDAVTACRFADDTPPIPQTSGHRVLDAALNALDRYFRGELTALDEVQLDFSGTPFRTRVWNQLRKIPAGQPLTYGAVASRVGSPRAARAVGSACGANPICLFVPCHRVVAGGGSLGGFGGGVWRKEKLLELERR